MVSFKRSFMNRDTALGVCPFRQALAGLFSKCFIDAKARREALVLNCLLCAPGAQKGELPHITTMLLAQVNHMRQLQPLDVRVPH